MSPGNEFFLYLALKLLVLRTTLAIEELLAEVASGDEEAFKLLFDQYRVRLFQYISRMIKSDQVAEELVMDVFMKIWVGKELLTQIENFDHFLFRIAHNKSIDFLRSAARSPKLKELLWEEIQQAASASADSEALEREFVRELRKAVSLLSPQRKKVYLLSREQDYTHDQIAEQLEISKATVNNHIVEAQRFIRSYLSKNLDLAIVLLMAGRI